MKWFKHETDSLSSEKLSKLIHEFGFGGYGRYWRIMELVAERMDGTSRCGVELPEKEWLRYLLVRRPLFRRYLVVIAQLFDIKVITTGLLINIEIPNLLKKRDNYTKDLQAPCKKLAARSRSRSKKEKKEDKILSPRTPLDTFLDSLKENPVYKGIDIDREIHKMNAWFLTPKGKGRKLTHKFILNWLNKCEQDLTPLKETNKILDICSHCKTDKWNSLINEPNGGKICERCESKKRVALPR